MVRMQQRWGICLPYWVITVWRITLVVVDFKRATTAQPASALTPVVHAYAVETVPESGKVENPPGCPTAPVSSS